MGPFTLNRYYVARTAETIFSIILRMIKDKVPVKKSVFLPCDGITFLTDSWCTWQKSKMVKFLNLLIRSKPNLQPKSSRTAVCTQFKDKMGSLTFCLSTIFLLSLNEKIHIKFAVDSVFEIHVSTKIVQ